jgi:phage shock protein A
LGSRISEAEAIGAGQMSLSEASVEKRLEALERADRVDRLLAELKQRAS